MLRVLACNGHVCVMSCHIRMWMGWCGSRSCARKPISFTCAWTIPNLGKSWRPDSSLSKWLMASAVVRSVTKAYPNKSSSDPWGMLVPGSDRRIRGCDDGTPRCLGFSRYKPRGGCQSWWTCESLPWLLAVLLHWRFFFLCGCFFPSH